MIRRTTVVGIALAATAAAFVLSPVASADTVRGTVLYVEENGSVVHLADGRIVVLKPSATDRQTAVTGKVERAEESPAALPRVLKDAADIPPERVLFIRAPEAR
jgi:hypothetical protein